MKRKVFFALLFIMAFALSFFVFLNISVLDSAKNKIYKEIAAVPSAQTALVLGALVYQDGSLSDIVRDRLDTAIELYEVGKVSKLLVSGDHGRYTYDEVNAMKDYLLASGLPKSDIFLDHAGFDTYDSVYRAQAIFAVENLIIVTQEFHLPRALYIAEHLNIEAVGIVADKHIYIDAWRNDLRESLARVKAYFNLLFHSKPTFLGEAIPITGDSGASWDE